MPWDVSGVVGLLHNRICIFMILDFGVVGSPWGKSCFLDITRKMVIWETLP